MTIRYTPDVSLHGRLTTVVDADELRAEPSLTLCTAATFDQWAGPVSRRVFSELASTSGFERMAARAAGDSTLAVRISVYVVWLEEGEYPSYRPDWHIDRIGGLRKREDVEFVDLRDPVQFPSFLLATIFLPESGASAEQINSRSTEFLLSTFAGESGLLWADMREMHKDIDSWLARNPNTPVLKVGDRMIAGFSPRTVHRPGRAAVRGWSYVMRAGLYTATEPCSPYPDHFVFFNPVYDERKGRMHFRRVGSKDIAREPAVRSVSLATDHGVRAATEFVRKHALPKAKDSSSIEAEIAAASSRGLAQFNPDDSARDKERESFLLKELDLMETEIKRLRAEGPTRLQFLFTMTSALLGSLLVLAGLKTLDVEWARRGAIVVSLLLFAFSLVTYDYLLGRDISCDRNARATARIRRYFTSRSPSLKRHISWQISDEPTQWLREDRSGIRNMTVLIGSGVAGLFAGLLLFELVGLPSPSWAVGVAATVFVAFGMRLWSRRRLSAARARAKTEQRF